MRSAGGLPASNARLQRQPDGPAKHADAGPDAGFARFGAVDADDTDIEQLYRDYGPSAGAPAKQVAFVALYLNRFCERATPDALAAAVNVVGRALGLGQSAMKKPASEARALLDYGRVGHIPLTALPLPSNGATAAPLLARGVSKTSITKAAAARAKTLRGARGGRRPTTYSHLNRDLSGLILSATQGDEQAADSLDQIVAILREAGPPAR